MQRVENLDSTKTYLRLVSGHLLLSFEAERLEFMNGP